MTKDKPQVSCPSNTIVIIDVEYFRQLLERVHQSAILPFQVMAELPKHALEKNSSPDPIKTISLKGHEHWEICFHPHLDDQEAAAESAVTVPVNTKI